MTTASVLRPRTISNKTDQETFMAPFVFINTLLRNCVYTTLQCYLLRTAPLRTSSRLLISYIKPYQAVTSSTIGRWIKAVLLRSGIDTQKFSAHSTRSASTSKAAASVSADIILKTAGWSDESTFRSFYKRPVAITDQLSKAVLHWLPMCYFVMNLFRLWSVC